MEENNEYKIAVIGAGGAGVSTLNDLIKLGVKNLTFIAIDESKAKMQHSEANLRFTKRDFEEFSKHILSQFDFIILIIGLGGQTVSSVSKLVVGGIEELGMSMDSFITMPLSFESESRIQVSEDTLKILNKSSRILHKYNVEKLCSHLNPDIKFGAIFQKISNMIFETINKEIKND